MSEPREWDWYTPDSDPAKRILMSRHKSPDGTHKAIPLTKEEALGIRDVLNETLPVEPKPTEPPLCRRAWR